MEEEREVQEQVPQVAGVESQSKRASASLTLASSKATAGAGAAGRAARIPASRSRGSATTNKAMATPTVAPSSQAKASNPSMSVEMVVMSDGEEDEENSFDLNDEMSISLPSSGCASEGDDGDDK